MKFEKKPEHPLFVEEGVMAYIPDSFPEGFSPTFPKDPPSVVRLNLFPDNTLAVNVYGLLYNPRMFPDLLEAALSQYPELRTAELREDLPMKKLNVVGLRKWVMWMLSQPEKGV